MTKQLIAAALVLALDPQGAGYPEGCNVHIFPDGTFRADDGRPASLTNGEVRDWQMNAQIAQELISQLDAGKPILYDYEHNSLCGDSRAAGWIDKLVYVQGKGLYGHCTWTPDAAEKIAQKEYCFSSPYFYFDGTGAVKKLVSVALTNTPALDVLGAVGLRRNAALNNPTQQPPVKQESTTMDEVQAAALKKERDDLKAQVAALSKTNGDLQAQLTKLQDEQKAAALAKEKEDHAQLLQAALTDGRITPAQKAWAEGQSLAALTEYLNATAPLSMVGAPQAGAGTDAGVAGAAALSKEERAAADAMGVSYEDFAATKAKK